MKKFCTHAWSTEQLYRCAVHFIQIVVALVWLHAGYEKVLKSDFASSLSATLAKFAGSNPHAWYQSWLTGFMTDKSLILGYMVQWGEVAVGLGLLIALVLMHRTRSARVMRLGVWMAVLAFGGSMIMSANFYLAAGWMSTSTAGFNLIMLGVEATLFALNVCLLKKARE